MKVLQYYSVFCKKLNCLVQLFACGILVFIVGIVFVETICRYLLGTSLRITDELVSYLMPWMAMLGAGVALRRKELVFISALEKFPPFIQRIAAIISDLLILVLLAWCVKSGLAYTFRNAGQVSPTIRLSMAYPYASIPVGSVLMILYTAEDLLKLFFVHEQQEEVERV